jgi:putative tryptophan/tyrosine transport system substrate-binding protein
MTILSRRQLVQGAGALGLGLLAGCGRWPWQGQPPARVPRLGYLRQSPFETSASFEPFQDGLRELGYVEGQNLTVEYRTANGVAERLPDLAAELVKAQVDVIVAASPSGPVHAARNATSTIPIVMLGVTHPVEEGLVASLARPGGNVTGLSSTAGPDLSGKRVELLHAVVPGISRLAVLTTPNQRGQAEVVAGIERGASALGIVVQVVSIRGADEFESAFKAISSEHADGVLLVGGSIFQQHRDRIAELAFQHRMPSMTTTRELVAAGALMCYGPNFPDLARRGAYYVDKILKGASPADLPVEQPMRFDFVINLKTAQALGLAIPHHVLLQATEVIQ